MSIAWSGRSKRGLITLLMNEHLRPTHWTLTHEICSSSLTFLGQSSGANLCLQISPTWMHARFEDTWQRGARQVFNLGRCREQCPRYVHFSDGSKHAKS